LDLSNDQKIYVMILSQYVLPQLVLRTQKRRQELDKLATAVATKHSRRIAATARKRKRNTLASIEA
jgi:hypothetical protein